MPIVLMNFKIQQTYPSPTVGISKFNTLTYAQDAHLLVLYGEQKVQAQLAPEQAKKKIAFKTDKASLVPTTEKISVFSIANRSWEVVEARGKIPTPRSQFQTIYMNPCLIVYGGKTNGKLSNEVYALNCQNWTWKKLFSLDGPPPADQFHFFKVSSHTAGLLVLQNLWLLQLVDVKWELAANQLPGSVWTKIAVQIPEPTRLVCPLDQENLLICGQTKSFRVNLATKDSYQVSFPIDSLRILGVFQETKKEEQEQILYVMTENSFYYLRYVKRPVETIKQGPEKAVVLERLPRCCTWVNEKDEHCLFYVDEKGELLSISVAENEEQKTARVLGSQPQQMIRSNSCIVEEEENEDSSVMVPSSNSRVKIESQEVIEAGNGSLRQEDYLMDSRLLEKQQTDQDKNCNATKREEAREVPKAKEQTSRKNTYNIASSQTNPSEKVVNSQRFKHKTEEHGSKQKSTGGKGRIGNNDQAQEQMYSPSESIQLRYKLENILYNESVKRKLLEAKVDALEGIIRKSEKFVLMLCKYGEESEKQRHIEKVRDVRQELEWNWSRELYYRKEMEMNKLPSQVSHQIQETMNHIQY